MRLMVMRIVLICN